MIQGDGIGPEVSDAARRVLDASGVAIEWVDLPAGAQCAEECGSVLPESTVETVREYKVALKGPVTTPIGKGFKSVNVQLRQALDLYAAIRPVRNLPGVKTRFDDVDLVVFRENTEGLYAGIENLITPDVVTSLKVCTRQASERIAKMAFEYCQERGKKKVTVFHKANIMKVSDGLFIKCAREVRDKIAPEIEYQEIIIDNGCMQIVSDPSQFDVMLMENLYGDVLSDLCAGLVGGLGVVPGSNIGDDCAVFEAVHGSAPDIAGQNVANPLALIMSAVMMLNHIGEADAAGKIRDAYNAVLLAGNPEEITRDLGGQGTTSGFANALIKNMV
jgi:isocitrate dehydrogenase (NAD+)